MTAIIIIAVLVLISAAYLTVGYIFFNIAVVRKKDQDKSTVEDLKKHGAGEFVDEIIKARESFFDTEFSEVEIQSYDGLKLVAYFHETPDAKGTIILFHGYRSSPMNDFCTAKDFYISQGLNVLIPYQRAHGKSEGKYITYGIRERHDVHSWIDYINKTDYYHLPIFLSGLSMGCSTVLMSTDIPYTDNVKLIIADCGFTSPYDIFEHVAVNSMHVPFKPIIPALNFLCKTKAGFDVKGFSTVEALKNCKIPVFFIHGEDDTFVPPEMTLKAYNACASEKYLLTVPKAKHALSFLVDKGKYKPQIVKLISRYTDK